MGQCCSNPLNKTALEVIHNKRKFYITMKDMHLIKTMDDFLLHINITRNDWKKMELLGDDWEPLFSYSTFRIKNFIITRLNGARELVEIKALYRKN
jgi:hypothetical protein